MKCSVLVLLSVILTLIAQCQRSAVHLKHRVGKEGFQHSVLTGGVCFILLQKLVKVPVLFTVRQNLQTVLMVSHKLLINVQHRQQDVEKIR